MLPLLVRRLLAIPARPSQVRLRVPSTLRRNLSDGPEGPAIIVRGAIVGVGSFPPGHDAEAPCGSRGKDPDSRTVSVCFRRGPRSGRDLFASSASADPGGACLRRVSKSGRSLPSSSASASTGGCPYRLFAFARLRFRRVRGPFSAVSQRRFQTAPVTKILSAFQRLAPRSAVAFLLPTDECCASNPSRASPIYPAYPQDPSQRWISAPSGMSVRSENTKIPLIPSEVEAFEVAGSRLRSNNIPRLRSG